MERRSKLSFLVLTLVVQDISDLRMARWVTETVEFLFEPTPYIPETAPAFKPQLFYPECHGVDLPDRITGATRFYIKVVNVALAGVPARK